MASTIRKATPADLPAFARVFNAAYPKTVNRFNPEQLRHLDETLDPKYLSRRYVFERDGEILGGHYSRIPVDIYHPQKFTLTLAVDPGHQRQGVGSRLYDHLVSILGPHDPICLRCSIREDMTAGVRFLRKRGYVEEERGVESCLELADWDPSPLEEARLRVKDQGLEIKTLDSLKHDDPDWDRKLYDLVVEVEADMPMPDPYTPPSLETLTRVFFEAPFFLFEAVFLIVDDGRYVALSNLERDLSEPDRLITGLTGTRRSYRRRGLARTLKLVGLDYARRRGMREVRTVNDAVNRPMLAINERLGFRPFPPWIGFRADLGETGG